MSRSYQACTQEQFLKDVAKHDIQVLRDDGLYRHIRFKELGTMMQHFDFVTWPGYLAYSGDMGTYVFTRLDDMFEFFRAKSDDGRLRINLSYWSEKLIAVDGQREGGAAKEFSAEKFTAAINEYRVDWVRDARREGALDKAQRRELWESVDSDVLSRIDDDHDGSVAQRAAYEFSWSATGKRRHWQFQDLFEHSFTEYTHRFVWCCYALAWGIQRYDASKVAAPADEVAA